jgi:hypothetical protein
MKLIFFSLIFAATSALASKDLAHRPRSFALKHGKAVFVDFTEAIYDITYDLIKKEARVKAQIKFDAPEAGHPIFDSVTEPSSVTINGKATSAPEVTTPENETTLRVLKTFVQVGSHTLDIELPLTTLVEYEDGAVKSAFWYSDLSHRRFLESYMPASFEYDQVKMIFNVNFVGAKTKQLIYTNGTVESTGMHSYRITYPEYYNVSSIFYHTVPEGSVNGINYTLKSIDGREVPVVIYTAKGLLSGRTLEKFSSETNKIFHELEADYGAWPHPSLVIYSAGRGGMEYCGATITEFRALGHELFHSYFARGVMPANGNAGWLDEALASWRDNGYKQLSSLSGSSMMSAHPYYTRVTDRAAYSFGERFMRLMDGKLQEKGGLKPFMRYMVDQRLFAPLFVEEFINEMEAFYGVSLDEYFKKFTFASSNNFAPLKSQKIHNHMHPKITLKELKNYL